MAADCGEGASLARDRLVRPRLAALGAFVGGAVGFLRYSLPVRNKGTRYRIHYGTQTNIEELNNTGQRVCKWCFVPDGDLVAGDVMLAQKIALETNERGALAVAHRSFVSM